MQLQSERVTSLVVQAHLFGCDDMDLAEQKLLSKWLAVSLKQFPQVWLEIQFVSQQLPIGHRGQPGRRSLRELPRAKDPIDEESRLLCQYNRLCHAYQYWLKQQPKVQQLSLIDWV